MDVSIAELRVAINRCLDYLEADGRSHVALEGKLVWWVAANEARDVSRIPSQLCVSDLEECHEAVREAARPGGICFPFTLYYVAVLLTQVSDQAE